MREIERVMQALNLLGSIVAGLIGAPVWFLASGSSFLIFLVLDDRALRRRIGARAWPSEGFARFNFNTNLNFALSQMLVGALLFALAGMGRHLVAG